MAKMKAILVAVDGSGTSDRAARMDGIGASRWATSRFISVSPA